ncbi:MAG: hypothetical protein GY915_00535 [bacterium]|nr:hypothetical protein [bacterium]
MLKKNFWGKAFILALLMPLGVSASDGREARAFEDTESGNRIVPIPRPLSNRDLSDPLYFCDNVENIKESIEQGFKEQFGSYKLMRVSKKTIGEEVFTAHIPKLSSILSDERNFAKYGVDISDVGGHGFAGLIRYYSETFSPESCPLDYDLENATRQEVEGAFFLPKGTKPKGGYPLSIIVPGSSGMNDGHLYLATQLMEHAERAVFIPMSYFSRGILETFSDQTRINPMSQVADIIEGIKNISDHFDVDISDMTILGTSRGADIALSFWNTDVAQHLPKHVKITGILGAYPSAAFQQTNISVTDVPSIKLICGIYDGYTPIGRVEDWVDRVGTEIDFSPLQLIEVDSGHGFFVGGKRSLYADEPVFSESIFKFNSVLFYDPENIRGGFKDKEGGAHNWSDYKTYMNDNSSWGAFTGGPWKEGTKTTVIEALRLGRPN